MRSFYVLAAVLCGLCPFGLRAQLFSDTVRLVADESLNFLVPAADTANHQLLYSDNSNELILVSFVDGEVVSDSVSLGNVFLNGDPIRYQDFNGDGFPDILTSRVFYFGSATGFSSSATTPIGTSFSGVGVLALTDFNADGLTDIFGFSNPAVFGDPPGAAVLMTAQRDSLGFRRDTIENLPDPTGQSVAVDIDQDGDIDLCYNGGDFPNNTLSCYVNDGSGGGSLESVDFDPRRSALAMADINGDGFPDAIYPESFGGVMVLPNNGGSFVGASPLSLYNGGPQEYTADEIITADVDQDGDQDLITVLRPFGEDQNLVAYHINEGNFTFADPVIIYEFTGFRNRPQSISIGERTIYATDLDGNGVQDIIVNNYREEISYALLSTVAPSSVTGSPVTATEVRVFPNPVGTNRVSFELAEDVRNLSVRVFDAAGRTVNTGSRFDGRQLSVAGLPAGIYTVLLRDDNSRLYRARFTKR